MVPGAGTVPFESVKGLDLIRNPCAFPASALTAQNVGDDGWGGSRRHRQRTMSRGRNDVFPREARLPFMTLWPD